MRLCVCFSVCELMGAVLVPQSICFPCLDLHPLVPGHDSSDTHTHNHLYTPLVRGAHILRGAGVCVWRRGGDKMEAGETDDLHKGRVQTH